TGPLHWEPLLKARAIETGSYVIAAAQCGEREGVRVYGQSRIISPFGEVIAAAGDDPCVITAEVDSAVVAATRHRLPTLLQRREIGPPRVVMARP
ncbi:MAG: nitrilase-related carbon-nitrogen hydrolase, partial [Nitratireductor sp.]